MEEVRDALAQQLRQSVTQSVVNGLRQEAEVELFDINGDEIETASSETEPQEQEPAAGVEATDDAEADADASVTEQ